MALTKSLGSFITIFHLWLPQIESKVFNREIQIQLLIFEMGGLQMETEILEIFYTNLFFVDMYLKVDVNESSK